MDRMFTFKAVKYKTFRKAANVQGAAIKAIFNVQQYFFPLITMSFDYVNPSYLFNLGTSQITPFLY